MSPMELKRTSRTHNTRPILVSRISFRHDAASEEHSLGGRRDRRARRAPPLPRRAGLYRSVGDARRRRAGAAAAAAVQRRAAGRADARAARPRAVERDPRDRPRHAGRDGDAERGRRHAARGDRRRGGRLPRQAGPPAAGAVRGDAAARGRPHPPAAPGARLRDAVPRAGSEARRDARVARMDRAGGGAGGVGGAAPRPARAPPPRRACGAAARAPPQPSPPPRAPRTPPGPGAPGGAPPPLRWGAASDEESLNAHEAELLSEQLAELVGKPVPVRYEKLFSAGESSELQRRLPAHLAQDGVTALVFNFIDQLTHGRSESAILYEVARDEAALRGLTRTWFERSPVLAALQEAERRGVTVLLTSDHGSIHCERPATVFAKRDATANLRYKFGEDLRAEDPEAAIAVQDLKTWGLPANL